MTSKYWFCFLLVIIISFTSCKKEESDDSDSDSTCSVDDSSTNSEFKFNNNLHNSLPKEWIEEYHLIMNNLDGIIPIKSTNCFSSLDVYAWNSNTDKPFKDKIGDRTGACICGNDRGRFMVLEIPSNEFEYKSSHRYSVIPHEYFHVYQMSYSTNFYNGNFKIKWLTEGAAASFESLYTQQYYSVNYFKEAQTNVNIEVINDPKIFESYDSYAKDQNYSSSVFMTVVLVKELLKYNFTEENAFKLVYKDFWLKNPTDDNWKIVFNEVFGISVDAFYKSLKSYTNDITTVLPSENVKLQDIFSN